MALKTARQKIQLLFWIISAAGVGAIIFALTINSLTIGIIFIIAYVLQTLGAMGLALRWFTNRPSRLFNRPGKIINFIQYISGALAVFAMFDFARLLLGKINIVVPTWTAIGIHSIAILLFSLWLLVSHFIRKDVSERKVCEFC